MKILMVCLGNICRSPLAHGIMEQLVREEELDWDIDSAGTSNMHVGSAPDKRSIAVAKKYGIDISEQRGRQFSQNDFAHYDYIYAMDKDNLETLVMGLMISAGWLLQTASNPQMDWRLLLVCVASMLIVLFTRVHLLWLMLGGALAGAALGM